MKILATAALAVLLVLGAALAACGSDDDTQQQQSAAQTRQTEQQPEQQTVAAQPADAEPQAEQEAPAQQPADQQQEQQEGSSRAFGQRTTAQDDADDAQQQATSGDQSEQSNQSEQAEPADQQVDQQQQAAPDEPQAEQERQQQSAAEQTTTQTATQQQADEQVEAEQEERQASPPQPQQDEEEAEQEAVTVTLVDDDDDPPPELPAWASDAAREAATWSDAQLQARADEIAASGSVNDITGITRWLNGGETTIARELARGNVVLIDFWTYTCINCVRTLPFLREWHAKYADRGLTIIGVHTPEFEFEEVTANVVDSMKMYDVGWLVAQDNDWRTWRAFNNRYWPAKYLIGPAMDVRYQHFGEGDYLETEHEIRRALEAAGWDISDIPEGTVAVAPQRDPVSRGQTRELYGGTRRNYGSVQYAAQPEYYLEAGVAQLYTDFQGSLISRLNAREHHKWYLQGLWRNDREAIVHARVTENLEDYLAFKFTARTVNVVLTVAEGGQPFNVYIEMDGRWLQPNEVGADIRFDDEGRSYVRVTRNDLYRLVVLEEWSTHELKLRSNSDQLAIFAFTFGSYLGGE